MQFSRSRMKTLLIDSPTTNDVCYFLLTSLPLYICYNTIGPVRLGKEVLKPEYLKITPCLESTNKIWHAQDPSVN